MFHCAACFLTRRLACFILTCTFPILNITLGASGPFWLFGVICVIALAVHLLTRSFS